MKVARTSPLRAENERLQRELEAASRHIAQLQAQYSNALAIIVELERKMEVAAGILADHLSACRRLQPELRAIVHHQQEAPVDG